MRLSRRISLLGLKENRRSSGQRTRKKHKKLDAICENVYNLNHRSVITESNADMDEAELRRSTRVRRAPVVLDASPLPAKKRRRVEFRSDSGSLGKRKRRKRVKDESGCSNSAKLERESGGWRSRLRARAKKGKGSRRDNLSRAKKRLFKVKDKVSNDDMELESSVSTVVKSKRPGRIEVSNVLKTHQEKELQSSESSEDEQDTDEDEAEAEDDKITSEFSDHEENDEVDEGHSSKSDEDGEDTENEAEDKEGKIDADHDENDEVDESETSESDEDGEDNEKNGIRNHIGKKEARDLEGNNNADMSLSSESDEDGEDVEENDKAMDDAKEHKENNKVDVITEKNDVEEDQDGDEVKEREDDDEGDMVKASDENKHLVFNGDLEVNDGNSGHDNLEMMKTDEQVELEKSIAIRDNQMDFLTVGGVSSGQIEIERFNERPLHDENVKKSLSDTNGRRYLRVGRRCGLCGRGSDGKPPKTLVDDGTGSDHEGAYSGSSASEDVRYDTYDGFGGEPGWLGRLLGPINDRYGIAGIWVHQHCAVWSPEVYFAGLGCLKNVRAALSRGRVLKCTRCCRPGATIGCRVDRCPKTYHLPCARANGCIFDHKAFLIACTDHRHLFQPHGGRYHHDTKKMKTKKLKLEMRKASGDAWKKDLEAEEKYLENCGEDEEFLKRESKRLQRDLIRIAPVYIGGSSSNSESQFQGWESVAGLQNVIQSLKEVVILPLLYPEFFSNMGLTPPRGVLLHGYPGTGKTLVVRALIGSCAQGDKRIAYFARKGADCLGKYVGDAERQLRLLFQVAEKSQPSIIFFDEIDGLAPCRTRQQDQTHNSVVSTLLALMDGLKSRGSVVVIGATNRPDSVDSALRRPGRFDREIYFPLPSFQDREAILSLHTRKWPKPVPKSLLKQISRRTVGFAGADLQSLCTQAAIMALRRSCPFQEILSAAEKNGPLGKHPPLPTFVVEERDWLEALRHAPPPCSQRGTEMAANNVVSSPLHTHLIPSLLQPLSVFLASLFRDERILLPCRLLKAVTLVKGVVVSALDRKRIPSHKWWSHVHDMLLESDVSRDVEIELSRCGLVNGQVSGSSSNNCDEGAGDSKLDFSGSNVQHIGTCPNLWQNVTGGSGKNLGFWCLVSGSPGSGQRYLASCILHCFTGNVEIQKLDSATISLEGQGDFMHGVTRILMKCASVGSSLIFMPRIDLWAIETDIKPDKDESDSSSKNSQSPDREEPEVLEMANFEEVSLKTSRIWNIFVEQVESISVSSCLTILATSESPFEELPNGIKQFFKSGKLDSRSPTPLLEETIPRFSVQVDGRFSRDSVISSSVMELSNDIVQKFVQLTHLRVHANSSPYIDINSCDTLKGNANNHIPANEVDKARFPESSLVQLSNPPNSRLFKGKSNLLLAIATLGYQILRYPHFAELCWATSKLKEGPCTNTKGPWKGWPFNSCVVRPNKSPELAVVCSSSNIKSRENYGLVRGLIAVGLLAYRGMYTAVWEVSSEVRKVLELLADQINAKIRNGKDPYQYIRLLSQMAYFEDLVNSWAYSLQSLDEDAQATFPPTCTNLKSHDNSPFEDIKEKKDGVDSDISAKSFDDTAEQNDGSKPAKSSDPSLEKGSQSFDLDEPMGGNHKNPEGGNIADEPPGQILSCHSIPVSCKQDEKNTDPCTLETPGNHSSDNGVNLSNIPNGFGNIETVFIDKDGPSSGGIGSKSISTSTDINKRQNEMTSETNIAVEDDKSSSVDGRNNVESNSSAGNNNSLSNDSGMICFYRCCSECVVKLRKTIRKMLTYEWGLRDNGGFNVEDVHDLVVSVSMNLHSSLRKIYVTECDKGEKETKQANVSDDGSVRPQKCNCHSTTTLSQNLRQENDLKFIFRDGVMSLLDPEEVTSINFHCKYETICLTSLIDWIVMTKQPSG